MFGTNRNLNQIKNALIVAGLANVDSTDSEVSQAVIDLIQSKTPQGEVKEEVKSEEPQPEEVKNEEPVQEDWKIALAEITAQMNDMAAQIVAIAKSGQPSPTNSEKETEPSEVKKERAYMKNPINQGVKMPKIGEE